MLGSFLNFHRRLFFLFGRTFIDRSQSILGFNVLVLALFLFFPPSGLFASTIISGGSISADITWTKASSPYIVDGDVFVDKGVKLTIEPGVVIKMKSASNAFFVNGTLEAKGLAGDEIYFTSIKDDSVSGDSNGDGTTTLPTPRDWDQLYVLGTGRVNFSHSIVRYAGHYSGGAGIHNAGGQLLIDNSQFSNNPLGIYQESGSSTITKSDFSQNNIGFYLSSGSANIGDSRIYHNSNYGVYSSYGREIDARNNWWGDDSGPYHPTLNPSGLGDKVGLDGVLFDPWTGQAPAIIPPTISDEESFTTLSLGFSSVAFIPGVEASFLYRREPGCILINCENELWVPNRNDDARKLFMTTGGESIDKTIYTREVIDKAFFGMVPIYSGFLTSMKKMVDDGDIAGFEALPYDWRFDLDKVVSRGATSTVGATGVAPSISYNSELPADSVPYLIAEIQKLADNSKTGKVTLVAHSNGGLVIKTLMQKLQSDHNPLVDKIDKVILVAVPELGTPEAIPTMLHGADQALGFGFLLNGSVARQAMENMSSAYNLLPSDKYFSVVQEPAVKFDVSVLQVAPALTKYGPEISSADKLRQFVLGGLDGRAKPAVDDLATPNILNAQMVANSKTTHDNLDNWQFPTTTEVIQIAGWGIPTLKTTEYLTKDGKLDIKPILTTDGDGTVVSPSATGAERSDKNLYLDVQKYNEANNKSLAHKDIFETNSIQQEISNLVKNAIDLPNYFSLAKPIPTVGQKNLLVSVHSPVTLDAYDSAGNHTGLIPNSNATSDLQLIEENIPNSKYLDFGEGKYISLPDNNYNLKLTGTGFGTFSYDQEETMDGVSTTTVSFIDIPVTPTTLASISMASGTTTEMKVDLDGDGINDFSIKPSNSFDPVLYLKMMKKVVSGLDIKPLTKKLLELRIDNMIRLIEKGKIKNVEKKIKAINWANNHIHWSNHLISSTDRNTIVKMLNQLLDNLE